MKKYTLKNRRDKYSKLSQYKTDRLVDFFVDEIPAKEASDLVGVSSKTVYKKYNYFRMVMIGSAIDYLELFGGAGGVLFLGEPPDIESWVAYVKERYRGVNNSLKGYYGIFEGLMREFAGYDFDVSYSNYFRFYGVEHFKKTTDKPVTDKISTINQWDVIYHNWGITSHKRLNLKIYDWLGICSLGKVLSQDEIKERFKRDLRWSLNKHNLSRRSQLKNLYWTSYAPTKEEITKAQKELSRLCHKAYKDHYPAPTFRSVPEYFEND